jgi:hypothetical protein
MYDLVYVNRIEDPVACSFSPLKEEVDLNNRQKSGLYLQDNTPHIL